MGAPLKVFICYKKKLSQKTARGKVNEHENYFADILSSLLKDAPDQYDVWRDEEEIGAGVAWETDIYSHILVSDVLLVLIGPGTSKSHWVQREIALAHAVGVAVVPIGAGLSRDQMDREMKALSIDHLQGKIPQNLKSGAGEALRNELRQDLERARARTKKQQDELLRNLLAQRSVPDVPEVRDETAQDNQRAASFKFNRNGQDINIHVASGDIQAVRGIDVLVNSENDYMQMARIFESRTVSSMLRRRGALFQDGKYEDTIQRELDWQTQDRGRPLQAGDVFITSSGSPTSELVQINKARYILHVAAVQAVSGKVVPFKEPYQIESCVRASLGKVCEINELRGVISQPGTAQHAEQTKLAAEGRGNVQSIIFPLFGTGQGGSSADEVFKPIFTGIKDFFEDPKSRELSGVLTDIYISAFKKSDVNALTDFLRDRLA